MWTIFQVFTEFVTILLLFHVLNFWPSGTWHLSLGIEPALTVERPSLSHWTAREVSGFFLFIYFVCVSLLL